MAYSALPAKVAGDTITLANWDNIRDNFQVGFPDLVTAKGDLVIGTGADAGSRLGVGSDDAILIADSGESAGMRWQIIPRARVYNDANIDPATGTWVALTFNQERYDGEGCHSTVSNTGRLTVPTDGAGIYAFGGNVTFDTSGESGQGEEEIRVRLNATTVIAQCGGLPNTSTRDLTLILSSEYPLVATDYLELEVYTSKDVDVLALSNYSPVFWMRWVAETP